MTYKLSAHQGKNIAECFTQTSGFYSTFSLFFTPVHVKKQTLKHQNTNNGSVNGTLLLRLVTAKQDPIRNVPKPDKLLPLKTFQATWLTLKHTSLLIQVLKLRRKKNIFKNQIILYLVMTRAKRATELNYTQECVLL